MNLRRLLPTALSVLALLGCATVPTAPSPIPSDREVVAYVTTNWDSYDRRLAYLSDRRGQRPTVVSVTNVRCEADAENAKCTFLVQGRFEDGAVLRRPMESLFQRQADGSIEMLIPVVRR